MTAKNDKLAPHVDTYLFFNGRCEEAIKFYQNALGAEVEMLMRFKESPDKSMIAPGVEEKVMHASIKIGDTSIMVSDGRAQGTPKFEGFSLSIPAADAEQSALSTLSDLVGIDDQAARTPPRPERPAGQDTSLALAKLPLLAKAPASVVSDLVKHTTQIEAAPGDVVFSEGDAADAVYVVLSGTLTISIDGEDVREIAAGDWFGDLAVLRRSNRTATVRGSTPAVLLAIQADAFRAAVETSSPDPRPEL